MANLTISGVIVCGHQVASRPSEHYPRGTIEMQIPFFHQLGFDLSSFYRATLNISISPRAFAMKHPQYTFRSVKWTSQHPPEHFSFSACRVLFDKIWYEGWVYYPHPETKKRHFQNPSLIEVIAPFIPGVEYGTRIEIELNTAEISVI
ncbi:MAG: hypothetical protein JXB07_16460 [Anaerolineae bacterium]|nr:hypothetical protein [Anaerolineae bacterium]